MANGQTGIADRSRSSCLSVQESTLSSEQLHNIRLVSELEKVQTNQWQKSSSGSIVPGSGAKFQMCERREERVASLRLPAADRDPVYVAFSRKPHRAPSRVIIQ